MMLMGGAVLSDNGIMRINRLAEIRRRLSSVTRIFNRRLRVLEKGLFVIVPSRIASTSYCSSDPAARTSEY